MALEHILKIKASGISINLIEKVSFLVDFDPKIILAPTNWGGTFCHQFNTYLSKKEFENTSKYTLFTFAKVKIASASFGFSPKNSQNRDSAPGIEGGSLLYLTEHFFQPKKSFQCRLRRPLAATHG